MPNEANPVEGKVIIEVTRKYVSIFRCDGAGAVHDSDHFAFPYRLDRGDAVSQSVDIYSIIYDWLNREVNGDSARVEEPPPDSK
jgi:hypothetical protein